MTGLAASEHRSFGVKHRSGDAGAEPAGRAIGTH